jgi:hypothetical protein
MAGDSGIDRGLVDLRAGQFVGEERRDRGEVAQGLRVAYLNVSEADAGVVPVDCDVCRMRNGARTRLIADGTNHLTDDSAGDDRDDRPDPAGCGCVRRVWCDAAHDGEVVVAHASASKSTIPRYGQAGRTCQPHGRWTPALAKAYELGDTLAAVLIKMEEM